MPWPTGCVVVVPHGLWHLRCTWLGPPFRNRWGRAVQCGRVLCLFFLTLWFMKRFGEHLVKNCCSRGCLWPIQLVFHQSTGLLIELEVREDEKSEKLRISGDFYLGHFHINMGNTWKIALVIEDFLRKKCNFKKVGWNSTWTSKRFVETKAHGSSSTTLPSIVVFWWVRMKLGIRIQGKFAPKIAEQNLACFFLGIDSPNQATIVSWFPGEISPGLSHFAHAEVWLFTTVMQCVIMCLKDAFLTGGIAPPYAAWTCAEQQLDGVGIWDSESTECHMINGGFCIQYNEWLTRVRCRGLLRWWLLVEAFPSSYLHSGSFLPLNTNQKMEESLTSFTPLKAFLEYLSHLLNLCL